MCSSELLQGLDRAVHTLSLVRRQHLEPACRGFQLIQLSGWTPSCLSDRKLSEVLAKLLSPDTKIMITSGRDSQNQRANYKSTSMDFNDSRY